MSRQVFQTGGDGIQTMHARAILTEQVWSALTKTTPSNLSVIGPRWIGKTVLLKAIADRAREDAQSPYSLVLHWHLGHVCPTTDAEFISGLCGQLNETMLNHRKDYSHYQESLKKESFSHLKLITDFLSDDNEPILMLWDGLDKPLGQEKLSVHLWDQMRSIIDGKKHKIVTATRAPLDLLIRNEQASTSEFWNIFDEVFVTPFSEADRDALLQIADLQMTNGGKKEVMNWTGGHPRLLLELLNRLSSSVSGASVDDQQVVEAATGMVRDVRSWLQSIWCECPQVGQDAYQALLRTGEAAVQEIGLQATELLRDRGFATVQRSKAKASCHLLKEHLGRTAGDSSSLVRLFKSPEDFRLNIGDVLRIRLEQITNVDRDLQRWVSQSILGLPEYPGDCLTNLTDIRDRALDLVMRHEFGPSLEVPKDLIEYWKDQNQHQNKAVSDLSGQASPRVSNNRALQVGLLQLLTGGANNLESKARSVTKDTFAMISALHDLRNRKEHADGQAVSESVAIATIMICLSLLESLSKELR